MKKGPIFFALMLLLSAATVLTVSCNPKRDPTAPFIPTSTPQVTSTATAYVPPTVTATTTACIGPDLVITGAYIGYSGSPSCLSGGESFGTTVIIRNQGSATAGACTVALANPTASAAVPAVSVSQSVTVFISANAGTGAVTSLFVDTAQAVEECNEVNNSWQSILPMPTQPPTCGATHQTTLTATRTATPTTTCYCSTPTRTPTRTATCACTSTVTRTPTATLTATLSWIIPSLTPTFTSTLSCTKPNLTISWVKTELQYPHSCLSGDEGAVGTRARVANNGAATSAQCYASMGATSLTITAIAAGSYLDVFFPGTMWPNNTVILVDPNNDVDECNETDNNHNGVVAICTPPPNCTASATFTATVSQSPTPTFTPEITCLEPKIIATDNYYYQAGYSMTVTASTLEAGLSYRLAVYDGSGFLKATVDSVSAGQGLVNFIYTFDGTENTTNNWHFAVMETSHTPAGVYTAGDTQFYSVSASLVAQVVPTPTPTMPCMNMMAVYNGTKTIGQAYVYRKNSCNTFTIVNHFCTEDAKIALYDGQYGNLLKVETSVCAPQGSYSAQKLIYTINGTESSGGWFIDLYKASETPPAVRTGSGGTIGCVGKGILVQ